MDKDIIKMVRKILENGMMLNGLNETNRVLIPKKKSLAIIGEFRPISLCNILVKIITKVLANRMKELLDKVV